MGLRFRTRVDVIPDQTYFFWQKSDSKENGKSQWDSIPLIIISYVILEKANAKIIDGRVNWQKA